MTENAKLLVASAAQASDEAITDARLAIAERSLDRMRAQIAQAKNAVREARENLDAAVREGDRLREIAELGDDPVKGGRGYAHYWALGRAKLDTANVRSAQALVSADSALACTATQCASRRAQEMNALLEAVSGATRDAESLLRIALLYVH
jgi:hypothetical protein